MPAQAVQNFIMSMANEAEKSSFEGLVPFSFWVAVETSCVSHEPAHCLPVCLQGLAGYYCEASDPGGGTGGNGRVQSFGGGLLVRGALLQALTCRNIQPLEAAAECIPAILA